MARSKECILTVCGDPWTAELLEKETYEKGHGKGSVAHTVVDDRSIVFSADGFSLKVVIHELFHAFHSYLYLNSTNNLSIRDHEEIMAEMLEDKLEQIYTTSQAIFQALSKKEKVTK